MFATVGGFALSVIFKFLPRLVSLAFLAPYGYSTNVQQQDGSYLYEIPFLDRMGFVFLISVIVMFFISTFETKKGVHPHGLEVDTKMFRTTNSFAVGAILILGLIVAIYSFFW